MKSIPSYRQPGEVVPVIAPYNVAAGDVVVVGGIVGLAATPATAGTSVEVCTTGVFAMKAATAEVIAAGAAVYWDSVAGNITHSVTATKLGNLIAAKASGVAEALVRVVSADGIRVRSVADARGGSQLRAGKPWLRLPSSVTGMLATSVDATIAAVTRRGRPAIEVTVAAVTTAQGIHIPIATPATITAFQHMVIEVEDAAEWNGGNWRLGFFDGTLGNIAAANGMQRVLTVGAANGWNGDHLIAPLSAANWISPNTTPNSAVSTSEWAAVGTSAFGSTVMTQIVVRGVRKAGPVGTARFWIYEIAEAEKNTLPQIVIGADDGHVTWYTDGLPILEKYGFSSYLAFIADERGTATRMSQAQWADACIARRHHAVVHGCRQISGVTIGSYRDYFSNTYGYPSIQAAIEGDIGYQQDVMVGEGLDPDGLGRTVLVLPQGIIQPSGGAGDNTIVNAMRNRGIVGARMARVEGGFVANGGGAGSVLYIPIIGHNYAGTNEASNISAIIAQMQAEIGAGRPVVLMFHEVRTSPTTQAQITAANLESIVSAAATLVRAGSARAGRLTDLVYETLSYAAPVHIGA